MRKFYLLMCLILIGSFLITGCMNEGVNNSIRVMTFNIRLNTTDDGPNQWPNRKDLAASMIRFHKADITGVQEALKDQMDDLTALLPEYAWFGVGRDDGLEAGEFMSVFYRKDRFEVMEESTFWLSETPDSVSKGWDAMCYRVVTWGKFKDKQTGKMFFLFNTHFDHKGPVARRESANLLLERINQIAGDNPIVVTGDFNSSPDTEPYQIITNGLPEMPDSKLINTMDIAKYKHHGPNGTITRFASASLPDNKFIDYVFIKNGVNVISHGSLSDTFDGSFPSDHMPVLAEVIVE